MQQMDSDFDRALARFAPVTAPAITDAELRARIAGLAAGMRVNS